MQAQCEQPAEKDEDDAGELVWRAAREDKGLYG
jgi:hypothetical protein